MATDTAKAGRPKGSKTRGATAKKRYAIIPAEHFKPLGSVEGINPKDALRNAFESDMLGDEADVVIVSERNVHSHKATAQRKVTLTVE